MTIAIGVAFFAITFSAAVVLAACLGGKRE